MLVATKITGTLTDTSGQINSYIRNWEAAVFASPVSIFYTNAGNVSVNGTALSDSYNVFASNLNNFYLHNDSVPIWNVSTLNHWVVSGSDTIQAFTADIDGTFPSFTGTLPTSVSTVSDFSFTFNSSNTSNGDSAYVIIYYEGFFITSNVVSASGGTVVISASKLAGVTNQFVTLSDLTHIGDPVYYGGFINIVIYNHTIQTFGGKQFAFVKQREVLGVVNFL